MTASSGSAIRGGIQGRRESFFARYPKGKTLDAALQTQDNRSPLFFLTTEISHADLRDVGFAIGRLGGDIERQFMINGEVAFFFAPWRDFQRRSFNAMTKGLAEVAKECQRAAGGEERFTPSSKLVILVSEDSQVSAKVEEWQQTSSSPTVVIPIPVTSNDPDSIRLQLLHQLRSSLGDRDLYRTQNPVTGDDFFGRVSMLREALAALESDENIAILGLRRSGKTSVLRELKRIGMARGLIVVMGDFQVLQDHSVDSLATSIARNLVDDLREARECGLTVKLGNPKEQHVGDISLPNLADRLKRAANRNSDVRFVVAIDEIESAARIARTDPGEVRTLLAALRAAAQACGNVSLAFSGVANRLFRSTVLGTGPRAVDNPMFGQVSSIYVTAFSENETRDLLTKLGRPMLLEWTEEAIHEVQTATGGTPYFVRKLASAVRKSVKESENTTDLSMVVVSAAHVLAVLPLWREEAGHDWGQLIEALRLHYPEAAELLDPALSDAELDQWIEADAKTKDAAEDLCQLGLLERMGGSCRRTAALVAIHDLIADRPASGAEVPVAAPDTEEGLVAMIKRGESHSLELKETFRISTFTGQRDPRVETEIARAVAGLMNADGGRLIVGVHDSGEIKGLARDLQVFNGDLDRFERWIMGDLLGKRIDASLASQLVRLSWVRARGVHLCALEVQRAGEAAWVDDDQLYVRAGNQTLQLTGRKLASFLTDRR